MDFLSFIPKTAAYGATAALGSIYLFGSQMQINLPLVNSSAPLWMASFGAGMLSSLVADLVHNVVKDEISLEEKAGDQPSLFLGALVAGTTFNVMLYVLNEHLPGEYGWIRAFAVGAGSEIAASYALKMLM